MMALGPDLALGVSANARGNITYSNDITGPLLTLAVPGGLIGKISHSSARGI